MTVHVVVVSWNGAEATLRCLQSLRGIREPELRVHVVDNGSSDDTVARVRRDHPEAIVQALPENVGFAAGANAGIREALAQGAPWIFLLNNDATLDADTLAALLRAAERRPDAGLYGGKIYRDRARRILWCCGVSLGFWPNLCRLRGHGRKDRHLYEREEAVDSLTGCGLLVARQVFERIGLLDERFFVYVEDADFCLRARAAGFSCLYVPDALMEHAAAASTGGGYSPGRKYLTAFESVRFLKRHGTPLLWGGFLLVDVAAYPLLLLAALARGRVGGALAKGRGMRDGLLGRPLDRGILVRGRG